MVVVFRIIYRRDDTKKLMVIGMVHAETFVASLVSGSMVATTMVAMSLMAQTR